MKKTLSILLSICLIAAFCVPAFAAPSFDIDSILNNDVVSKIKEIADNALDSVKGIAGDNETTTAKSGETTTEKSKSQQILDQIKDAGVKTDKQALEAVDKLYNDGVIDEKLYKEVKTLIENGAMTTTNAAGQTEKTDNQIIDELTKIFQDDSLDTTAKIKKAVDVLKGLPTDTITKILDELHKNGIINDDMYSKISDALNNLSLDKVTGLISGIGGGDGGDSPLSGIKDLVSGLLGKIGLGGGDDTKSTTKKASTGSSNSKGSSSTNPSGGGSSVVGIASATLVVSALAVAVTMKKKKNDEE